MALRRAKEEKETLDSILEKKGVREGFLHREESRGGADQHGRSRYDELLSLAATLHGSFTLFQVMHYSIIISNLKKITKTQ